MNPPRALFFDFGNTLIAFGEAQQLAQAKAMTDVLEGAGFEVDQEALTRLRIEQIVRPFSRDGVENDFTEVCREIVLLAAPDDPEDTLTRAIMEARRRAFIESVEVDSGVISLLERLRKHYRLGLFSNYPCADSIRDSLRHLGLYEYFESIVVSADIGYAKPHPGTFAAILESMDVPPEESVYIGDNWLADIQGAKRAGMRAVWVREHVPYERFDPQPGDHPADAELSRLLDLEAWLESQ